jgi:hypothetical protein
VKSLDVALFGGAAVSTGTLGMDDFTIKMGSTYKLRATMLSDGGSILAGSLPCTWSSGNPTVVKVASSPTDNLVTIEPQSTGKTTMRVAIDALELEFPITVSP